MPTKGLVIKFWLHDSDWTIFAEKLASDWKNKHNFSSKAKSKCILHQRQCRYTWNESQQTVFEVACTVLVCLVTVLTIVQPLHCLNRKSVLELNRKTWTDKLKDTWWGYKSRLMFTIAAYAYVYLCSLTALHHLGLVWDPDRKQEVEGPVD